MLTIRLQRTGKKNQADFRIVVAEKEAPVQKKFHEVLGSYNPRSKNFQVKEERVKYWLGQHIELSETVHNLFVTKNLLDAKKVKAFTTPKKPVEAAPAAAAPSAAVETPAEVTEATATMEAKVEDIPVEAVAAETPAPVEEPVSEPVKEESAS